MFSIEFSTDNDVSADKDNFTSFPIEVPLCLYVLLQYFTAWDSQCGIKEEWGAWVSVLCFRFLLLSFTLSFFESLSCRLRKFPAVDSLQRDFVV